MGISLSSIIGVITTKNLAFLIAPLILEPTTLYLVSKERQQNSKELSDKDSELKKALGIHEDSQNQLNAEKTKLESDIQNLQNEIQTLKINYEEKIKAFNDELLKSPPKEVISSFIDQIRLLSETKENLEKELLMKSKENVTEKQQRKKLEDLLKNKEKELIKRERSLLEANIQNQLQEDIITNQNFQKIIENSQQTITTDSYFYNLISGRTESRELLIKAIGESQTSLVIVCPWIKDSALNKPVNNPIKEELEIALKRGVNILIGWGYLGDVRSKRKSLTRDKLLKSRSRMFYTGIKILEELQKKYPEQLRLYVLGTHEKFLVVDESYGFIGSHNFLTSDDSSDEREIGIHTNNLDIIKELLNTFNKASEASAKPIEELPNTFNEASVKSINYAVPKITQPYQEVEPKIIIPKIVETYTEKFTIEQSRPRGKVQEFEFELEMVILPAGSFLMGSNDFATQKPIHQVTLKQFAIAKYPVTQEQYKAIMGNNPSRFKPSKSKDNPKNPVDCVNWNDSQSFCQTLNQKTGKNYRLPSESEWEYACRAGTQTRYYFGDNEELLKEYAWYYYNSDSKTHPVGEKKPNNWGLYDMYGNVYEWCEDDWHTNYENAPNNGTSWSKNDFQGTKLLRGGSWNSVPLGCSSAERFSYFANNYYNKLGFRLAVSIP